VHVDSKDYLERKHFFDRMLTIYGRKPCLEALQDASLQIYRLHLADSNKPAKILDDIRQAAEARAIEIVFHDKKSLSRISKNAKQDQGIAADVVLQGFQDEQHLRTQGLAPGSRYIALDRITNPQNLGMIIRSVCASPMTGLILPSQGCARLDSLVIKASAGTLFKAPIIRCKNLLDSLSHWRNDGAEIIALDLKGRDSLPSPTLDKPAIFILGNETDGVSSELQQLSTRRVCIAMANGVESLNVAVTAGIIAFRGVI